MTTTAPATAREPQPSVPPTPDEIDPWLQLPITLQLPEAVIEAGPDAWERWFVDLDLANGDTPWVMELNARGELELTMAPYQPSDEHEDILLVRLYQWNDSRGRPGTATGSGGAYRFPNNAIRLPDAAWTHADNQRPRVDDDGPRARRYAPDFVVEIRSGSQRLTPLLNKMREYMDNGAKLGWLIDPRQRTARIYRAGADEPELLNDPETLDGETILPGFIFEVRRLIFDLT